MKVAKEILKVLIQQYKEKESIKFNYSDVSPLYTLRTIQRLANNN